MKPNIIIRMGASKFTADVRGADGNMVRFDLGKMQAKEQHTFRRELTKAFRQSREGN
jgi:hypothetical protein